MNLKIKILISEMDYYDILQIDKNASISEIRKSYYKLAKIYHPDKNGNESKFKEINYAYEILTDEDKKRQYDEQILSDPYDLMSFLLKKYNLEFINKIFSKVYNDDKSKIEDINNLNFVNIYNNFRKYYNFDIVKNITCKIEDIYNKNKVKVKYVQKIDNVDYEQVLIIDNIDIYDSELVYEGLGNSTFNIKGNLIIRIEIIENNIYEIGDNYDLVLKLDNLDDIRDLEINIKKELESVEFLFENGKFKVYKLINAGFFNYDLNINGDMYFKINK